MMTKEMASAADWYAGVMRRNHKAFIMKNRRRFFFHYNKQASRAAGEPRLTVHWKGRCHLVAKVDCRVPVESKNNKRQPLCVLQGWSARILFSTGTTDGIAIICP